LRGTGGYGLAAQWSDDYHHALHTTLTDEHDGYYGDFEGFGSLVRVLERGWVYEGRHSRHRGRRHGRSLDGLALQRLIGYAQNHDQIGNRARGERLSQLVKPDALYVAAALTICGPFTPLLFQGQEWGARTPFLFFTDYGSPELAEAVRHGRREEFASFGWQPDEVPDPQAEETFGASRLDWSKPREAPNAALLEWHRQLIALRRSWPSCPDQDRPRVTSDLDQEWLVVDCCGRSVAANLGEQERLLRVPAEARSLVAASHPGIELGAAGLRLPPTSAAVVVESFR